MYTCMKKQVQNWMSLRTNPATKDFVLVHLLLCYYIFVRIFSKLHARMRSDTEAKSRISSSLDGKPSYESTDRKQGY